MFTGIIEVLGRVKSLHKENSNLRLKVETLLANELKVDQSVSHNGVCLTVVACSKTDYDVIIIGETIKRTNLGDLKEGDLINLERCLKIGDRLDGHMVQGHVDCTGVCTGIEDQQGSWKFRFRYADKKFLTVEKGSVAVNGVSLTVVDSLTDEFSVCIIPYTFDHTNFSAVKIGDKVNLEFDVIGKYVQKMKAAD